MDTFYEADVEQKLPNPLFLYKRQSYFWQVAFHQSLRPLQIDECII